MIDKEEIFQKNLESFSKLIRGSTIEEIKDSINILKQRKSLTNRQLSFLNQFVKRLESDATFSESFLNKIKSQSDIKPLLNYETVVVWNRETLADGLLWAEEYDNVYGIINGLFPTNTGYSAVGSTLENFVFYEYIQYLQCDRTTMLDEFRSIPISEIYWNEFLAQLPSTDFVYADGSPLPSDASHILRGDGITNSIDRRGIFSRGADVDGVNASNILGKYGGFYSNDAVQRLIGSFGSVRSTQGTSNPDPENPFFSTPATDAAAGGATQPFSNYTFDNSKQNRTDIETYPKNVLELIIQRVKRTNA
jgi:hypothetical protein